MNIVKERRKQGAVCPKCHSPDYRMTPPIEGETLKPEFRCVGCGNIWCWGYDGGKYAALAIRQEAGEGEMKVLVDESMPKDGAFVSDGKTGVVLRNIGTVPAGEKK